MVHLPRGFRFEDISFQTLAGRTPLEATQVLSGLLAVCVHHLCVRILRDQRTPCSSCSMQRISCAVLRSTYLCRLYEKRG